MSQSAYRRVCGAATPKPPVAIERVTPHGCPDAARGVQPGLRGLDGETPSCAGLCGGRTRSSRSFASLRMTKWSLDPVGVVAGPRWSGGQGAQPFDNTEDLVLQRPLLVGIGDGSRTGGQLDAVVVLAI